ncbi:MAG: hypothetical protein ABR961_05070 [Thermoanaerobaculaceae bacterium]|jgi:hypothetical protein
MSGKRGIARRRRCAASPVRLAVVGLALAGCVGVRAPLIQDAGYPGTWGAIAPLDAECRTIGATYSNAGELAVTASETRPVLLTALLEMDRPTISLTLRVEPRRVDAHGDSFVTLFVTPDGDAAAVREFKGCFCVKRALACTQVRESYWSVPNLGVGGSQRNLYLSVSRDGALVAKLQNYHVDVVLGVPLFRNSEPWVRFAAVRPANE